MLKMRCRKISCFSIMAEMDVKTIYNGVIDKAIIITFLQQWVEIATEIGPLWQMTPSQWMTHLFCPLLEFVMVQSSEYIHICLPCLSGLQFAMKYSRFRNLSGVLWIYCTLILQDSDFEILLCVKEYLKSF